MNTGFRNEESLLAAFEEKNRNIHLDPHVVNTILIGEDRRRTGDGSSRFGSQCSFVRRVFGVRSLLGTCALCTALAAQ